MVYYTNIGLQKEAVLPAEEETTLLSKVSGQPTHLKGLKCLSASRKTLLKTLKSQKFLKGSKVTELT